MAQVVECQPSKEEALKLNSSTTKKKKKKFFSQAWWYMPTIPALGRLRQ
jgi:hypothetical protein